LTKLSSKRLNSFHLFLYELLFLDLLFQIFFPYYKLFENFLNSLNEDSPISSQKTRKYVHAFFGIQTRHPNVLAARNYTRLGSRGHRDSDVRTMTGDDGGKVLFISSGSCYSRTQQIAGIKTV
jgi:hypothetical protein